MGRAIFGLLLGFTIVFGVAYWSRTCLPDPNDKGIEWVEREDAVIVQMKSVLDDPNEISRLDTVPQFTLYGDGTIIAQQVASPEVPSAPFPHRGVVSGDTIRSLLNFAKDKGYFDLAYEQPDPPRTSGAATYLYVNSKLAANAVRYPAGQNASALEAFIDKIHDVLGNADTTPYEYDSIVFIARTTTTVAGFTPFDLPDEIDMSNVTSESGVTTQILTGESMRELMENLEPGIEALAGDERGIFAVAYRPLLPFEENFPEFEPPTQ